MINPARVSAFRKSEGIRTKTDKQDAYLLARYVEQKRPKLWTPICGELQQLQVLMGRLDDLTMMRQQEKNRLENSRLDAGIRQEIQEHIAWLEQRIGQLETRATQLTQQQPEIHAACEQLDSVPGIAQKTAMRLISVIPEISRFESASQLAAYLGVVPAEKTSGSSVRGHASINKMGHAPARKWLYMCALVVLRTNVDFRRWGEELRARGKCWKVIHVAVMRKLVHLVFGVLKSQQLYDPCKAFPSHYHPDASLQEQVA